jgi:hypothetical protein
MILLGTRFSSSLPCRRPAIAACLGGALLSCANLPAQDLITLDPAVRYQTMRGWEVNGSISLPCQPNAAQLRDAVVRAAIHDVGINRLRVEIRSGAENPAPNWRRFVDGGCREGDDPSYQAWRANRYATVNDNADPRVIDWTGFNFAELDWSIEHVVLPFRRELELTGEELFVNVTYVAFTRQITNGSYHHRDPDEYAEFVLATHLHLRDKYGLVPDSWEVLLEPDNVPGFDGTLLARLMVAAGARLREHGFTPHFVAPSTTRMDNAVRYFDAMAAVPGALDHLAELSYHRYGGVSSAALQAIAERAERHGVATGMLEWWFGRATYEILHRDLKIGHNASWQGRTLGTLFERNERSAPGTALRPLPDVRFNRQYFRFIRRGAVRIEARSQTAEVDPLAFINPDGRHVVVVKTTRAAELTIAGLPAGRYGLKYTTVREYDVDLPPALVPASGSLQAAIPAAGVITIWALPPAR